MRRTCFETVLKLQKKNKKIIFVGSDLGPGFMKHSKDKVPERFFMEGVSEQAIVGMSAGLALEGIFALCKYNSNFFDQKML